MTPNQQMITHVRDRMIKCFAVLGGEKYRRQLSARFVDNPNDVLMREIAAAMVEVSVADMTQELVTGAREHGKMFGPAQSDMKRLPTMLLEAATSLGNPLDEIGIIVGPVALTILQVSGSMRRMETEDNVGDLPFVGLFAERIRVYCDQYASDGTSAIIFAPGWFAYATEEIVSAGADASITRFDPDKAVGEQAAEITHWIATDVMYRYNPKHFWLVGIDAQMKISF